MRRWLFIVLACAFALVTPAVTPAQAFALDGSYSIDELSTQLTVEPDAKVHIVVRQTITFADRNAGLTWYLHVPEDGESVRIASVRIAPVDDGGTLLGDWTRLQMIDSDPASQGRHPGSTAAASLRTAKTQPWYSYNIGDGMMRCYFPTGTAAATAAAAQAGDEDANPDERADNFHTYVIETDYTIAHRVRIYRDVAELYWRYVNDSLPVGAHNVTLQVVLPIPADADPAEASQEITAWGHGPSDGTFSIGIDGTVTYRIDEIDQGSYAEAHVIFPANWETDAAPNNANQFSELRRASAEAEETEWVDIGQRQAAWDTKVRALFAAIALVVLAVAAVAALRHGRTSRSRRAFVRAAATLAIVALGANLFFREQLTTMALAALAAVCAVAASAFPLADLDGDSDGLSDGAPTDGPLDDAPADESPKVESPDATPHAEAPEAAGSERP